MISDSFAPFSPAEWQKNGLTTAGVIESMEPGPSVRRKKEKWVSTTAAAVVLSAVIVGSLSMPMYFAASGNATEYVVIRSEEGVFRIARLKRTSEVPAGYWQELAREVATWPRASAADNSDEIEPMF
jgi:hypothetical protein